MKPEVLRRYARLENGTFVIDITAARVEDLYNNFDKSAPYIRRDLDDNLGDYLITSGHELKQQPYAMRFILGHFPEPDRQSRILQSINAYFFYLAEKERLQISQLFRKSFILLGIGIFILFSLAMADKLLFVTTTVYSKVMLEGLTVAAWVSMWNGFAAFLIEWPPLHQNVKVFTRLADTAVLFEQAPGNAAQAV